MKEPETNQETTTEIISDDITSETQDISQHLEASLWDGAQIPTAILIVLILTGSWMVRRIRKKHPHI